MRKFSQSNLMNFLIDHMYQLRLKNTDSGDIVDIKMADVLFNIWKSNKKISENTYRKPLDIPSTKLEELQKLGLIRFIGDRVEITSRGSEIIKTMILGDDRSSFEDEKPMDYKTALDNVKNGHLKKYSKNKENDWWARFKK